MSSTVVHVKNISSETSEKEVRDFFSFCGKITSLSVTPASGAVDSSKSATVTFEKETAAKTALLLDNTQLGPSQVSVSSAASIDDIAQSAKTANTSTNDDEELTQDDKPRSRVIAEYLAHGYVISDSAIQKALALDSKHGVSARFTNALTAFDSKYKATDKAKGVDSSYGITDKGLNAWKGLNSYFEKALETPTGQKLAAFYTQGEKQVMDVHAEARRLADIKSGKTGGTMEQNAKSMMQVPGTEKTTCQCGGESGACPCTNCACSGCSKASSLGGHTATSNADKVAASSDIAPLGEKQ